MSEIKKNLTRREEFDKIKGEKVTNTLYKSKTNIHKWGIDVNITRNKRLFSLVMIISIIVLLIPFIIVLLTNLDKVLEIVLYYLGTNVVVVLIIILVFYLYGKAKNGFHSFMFEMNERSLKTVPIKNNFRKGELVSLVAILCEVKDGNPQTASQGLLLSSKKTIETRYEDIKRIYIDNKLKTIKVRTTWSSNILYCYDDDFDYISEFIVVRLNDGIKPIIKE